MPMLIGTLLALAVGMLGTLSRMDRDRAFYPVATMVIGSLYVLFAVMGAGTHVLVEELLVGSLFMAAAVIGFRSSLWIVVVALVAHGLFDFIHGAFIANAGVPHWWPGFCATYDITAGAFLAFLLATGRVATRPVEQRPAG